MQHQARRGIDVEDTVAFLGRPRIDPAIPVDVEVHDPGADVEGQFAVIQRAVAEIVGILRCEEEKLHPFHEEERVPFEGAGAVSELDLVRCRQDFDAVDLDRGDGDDAVGAGGLHFAVRTDVLVGDGDGDRVGGGVVRIAVAVEILALIEDQIDAARAVVVGTADRSDAGS